MSIAVSVRVGNELGAGNPLRAKRASFMALGVVGTIIIAKIIMTHVRTL